MDKKCAMHTHHSPAATEWNALAANNVMQQQTEPFHHCRGGAFVGLRAVYVGKTSLALVVSEKHCLAAYVRRKC